MMIGISLMYFIPLTLGLFILFLFVRTPHGAPFVPSKEKAIEKMLSLVKLQSGEKTVDIGSGDGRIVMALAKKGADAHGYEINPLLVFWSRLRIMKAGLSKSGHIHKANLWNEDFSSYTLVTVYGIPSMMADLEEKLQKELPVGARVISNTFQFPTWKPNVVKGKIYLYTPTVGMKNSAKFQRLLVQDGILSL